VNKFVCIAVEDEAPAIELLKVYISHFPHFVLAETFSNALEARTYLKKAEVDVLFLDIQLPGISGMDFLKLLQKPPHVVITSAYSDHAIDAFGLEVVDYLLKPFPLARFAQTIDRLERKLMPQPKNPSITVKEGYDYKKFKISELLYVESQREYLIFYLVNGQEVKARMSMEDGLKLFPKESLLRIHRSFMVAVGKIDSMSANTVMVRDKSIPIGRSYRERVLEHWQNL
jgi:DNA-binding LytR/AlgR family response regulator